MPTNLRSKLNPDNLQGVAPAIFSVLGVLLNENLTYPVFEGLLVTPEGDFFLKPEDAGPPVYLGPISQVQAQLTQVAAKANLSTAEYKALDELFAFRTSGSRLFH